LRFVDAAPLPARRQPPVGRSRSGVCGAALAPRLPGRGVRAPGLGNAREPRLAVRLCKGSRRRRRPVATPVAVAFAAGRRHVPAGVNPKGPRHAADRLRAPHRAPRVSPSPARTRIIAQTRGWAHRGRLRTAAGDPLSQSGPPHVGEWGMSPAPARDLRSEQGSRSNAYENRRSVETLHRADLLLRGLGHSASTRTRPP
jgi:hypothetical protein